MIPAFGVRLFAITAFAEHQTIRGTIDIAKIVHSIPATGGDIAKRLFDFGAKVKFVVIHKITHEDPEHLTMGDQEITIYTQGEFPGASCQLLGNPSFIKRQGRYSPHPP